MWWVEEEFYAVFASSSSCASLYQSIATHFCKAVELPMPYAILQSLVKPAHRSGSLLACIVYLNNSNSSQLTERYQLATPALDPFRIKKRCLRGNMM